VSWVRGPVGGLAVAGAGDRSGAFHQRLPGVVDMTCQEGDSPAPNLAIVQWSQAGPLGTVKAVGSRSTTSYATAASMP
jgi:hypothetical protein